MRIDLLKLHHSGGMVEHHITEMLLTELGSSLYYYCLFLDNLKRLKERDLVESYRTRIFSLRGGTASREEIKQVLGQVRDEMEVQLIMLRSIPERTWETAFFQDTKSELDSMFWFYKDELLAPREI